MVRDLRGHSGFWSDDIASEVLGVSWSSGEWLVWCRNLGGWLEQSWGSSRGSILDWTESQQSGGDLDNLTDPCIPTRREGSGLKLIRKAITI